MNFYKHYLGDYARKTAHLSLLEHGAYRILLDHYYATLAPLPAEILTLCRICRAISDQETQAVSQVVSQFFPLGDDGLRHNSRADQEITAWKALAELNRERGKLGGRPKTQTVSRSEPATKALQKLEVRSQILEVRTQKPEDSTPLPKRKRSVAKEPTPNGADTWNSYAHAYHERYGVEPVRNAQVNAIVSRFCQRVSGSEAPAIASFYVRHDQQGYVRAKHPVTLLLRDAEGLRTEWATNRPVTETQARQIDKTSGRGQVFKELIDEAKNAKPKP